MKQLISQVNQLSNTQHHIPKETLTKNIWTNNFKPSQLDPFQQFNFQSAQQQHTPVWRNMLQPTNLESARGQPHFSSKKNKTLIKSQFNENNI